MTLTDERVRDLAARRDADPAKETTADRKGWAWAINESNALAREVLEHRARLAASTGEARERELEQRVCGEEDYDVDIGLHTRVEIWYQVDRYEAQLIGEDEKVICRGVGDTPRTSLVDLAAAQLRLPAPAVPQRAQTERGEG